MAYLVGGVGYFVLYTLFVAHGIGAGAILTDAGVDLPVGPETQVALRCLLTASTVGAIALGVRRWHPEPRAPWVLLAITQGLYTVADAIFYTNIIVFHNAIFPSLADLFYIGRYPFAIAALALLFRQRAPGRNLSAVLDTTSIAVAMSLLYWLYVVTPYKRATSGQLALLASVAFPAADLGLLVMSLILVLAPGRRPASFVLLVASLVVTLASDVLSTISVLGSRYVVADLTDSLWALGDVLVAAAALHPSMADLSCSPQADDRRLGPGRLAALLAAALIAPVLLLVEADRSPTQIRIIAVASAALALLIVARLAALVAEQRRLATTDVLTGLRTRRFLQNQLPAAVSRADRSGQPFALLLVDVDNFKSVNDRYGHPCGDVVLAEIGSRLAAGRPPRGPRARLGGGGLGPRGPPRGARAAGGAAPPRPGDLLARFGGEEFALLGPTVGPETVGELAERLRHNVARDLIELDSGARLRATVSVGAAVYPVHAHGQTDLLIAADRNLYAAKAAGRNRVVIGCGAVIESRGTADDPAAPPPRHG
ncbi:GGDEF domain-containing protein [Frankia sp. Mgl5]|uniref:GGDEF domain-containing protein n=1 Tax=Frankia sp. Mgl5 TaxID=2933793 RepID=UPI00200BB939|nr:GGDEF domain-containing protein [Frankia sp. Mgl5]MCK9931506.1 GGDEF domain-containing protein [Frankia sp. Mgl5]